MPVDPEMLPLVAVTDVVPVSLVVALFSGVELNITILEFALDHVVGTSVGLTFAFVRLSVEPSL
jgi:hypothetical protein